MAKEVPIQLLYTLTPNQAPDPNSLLYAELALELGSTPIKIWIGVPNSVHADGHINLLDILQAAFDQRYVQRA